MKKLLLITAVFTLLLSSCSKDSTKSTTYTFVDKTTIVNQVSSLDNCNYTFDIQIYEFYGNDKIKINTITNCISNKLYSFTAEDKTDKIKIKYTLTLTDKQTGISVKDTRWVSTIIYLKKQDNIDFVLNDNTMVTSLEP